MCRVCTTLFLNIIKYLSRIYSIIIFIYIDTDTDTDNSLF